MSKTHYVWKVKKRSLNVIILLVTWLLCLVLLWWVGVIVWLEEHPLYRDFQETLGVWVLVAGTFSFLIGTLFTVIGQPNETEPQKKGERRKRKKK